MNRLIELNTYSSETIFYTDERTASLFFDRSVATNISLTTTENAPFPVPIGIEIVEIVDYINTQPVVKFDFTNFTSSVTLDFGTLPNNIVVVESPANFFTVTGIQSVGQWSLIKSPIVQPPFGFIGNETFDVEIQWTDTDQVTTLTQGYTVSLTFIATQDISSPSPISYVPNRTILNTGAPNITANIGTLLPTFTLTIQPTVGATIDTIFSTASSGAVTSFDNATKTFTIIGTKDQLNQELDALFIDFSFASDNFNLIYTLSNNLNNIVEYQFQPFTNLDLAANLVASGGQLIDGLLVKFADAVFTNNFLLNAVADNNVAYVRFQNYTVANQTTTINENENTQTNNTIAVTAILNAVFADIRIEYDLTNCPIGTTLSFDNLPGSVVVNQNGQKFTVSNINTISEFDNSKNATINIPNNTFNDVSYTINVYYNNSIQLNNVISYTTNVEITEFMTFRDAARTYRSNQSNNFLAGPSVPQIQDTGDFNQNHRLTIQASSGFIMLNGQGARTSTYVVENFPENLNGFFENIFYYPELNQTSNQTIFYKLEVSNGVSFTTKFEYTGDITFAGTGSIADQTYTFDTAGSHSITIPEEFKIYNKTIDLYLVGGGGGASGVRSYPNSPASGLTASAGGGAGQIKFFLSNAVNNTASLNINVGQGGASGTGNSGVKGNDTSVTWSNNSFTFSVEGGYPGRLHSPIRSAEYFNPGFTVALEGGKTTRDGGFYWGDYIAGGNGYYEAAGGAGAGGNSWVGLNRSENLGGPGIFIDGIEYGQGGNGNYATALDPDRLVAATPNTPGTGGGSDGTVSGVVNGRNGFVKIVLKG